MKKIVLLMVFVIMVCSISSVAAHNITYDENGYGNDNGMTFREFLIKCCGLSPGDAYDFHLYYEYEMYCKMYGWTPVNDAWSDSGYY